MAATMAIARTVEKSGRAKEVSRLGSQWAIGQANTWKTFTTCCVDRNENGYVEVKRNGTVIHRFDFDFGPEA